MSGRIILIIGRRVAGLSNALACIACFYMLGIVAYNVAARAVYDATNGAVNGLISGALEQASYALLVFVFAALPSSLCFGNGFVRVDVLAAKLPSGLQRAMSFLWMLALTVFGTVLTFLLVEEVVVLYARGDTTQDSDIPLYLFYAIIAVLSAVLAFSAGCCLFGEKSNPHDR